MRVVVAMAFVFALGVVAARADAPPFDHAKTGWQLRFRHATLACRDCHTARDPLLVLGNVVDARGQVNCRGCHTHAFVHEDDPAKNACLSCHITSDTRLDVQATLRLAHGPAGSFPLVGKYKGMACVGCHHDRDRNGRTVFRAVQEPTLRGVHTAATIQLMEQVFISAHLDRTYAWPANAGWMRLFARYARSETFHRVWKEVGDIYGAAFHRFCNAHLDLGLPAKAAHRSGDVGHRDSQPGERPQD